MSTYDYTLAGASESGGTCIWDESMWWYLLENRFDFDLSGESLSGGAITHNWGITLVLSGGSNSGGNVVYGRSFNDLSGGSTSGGRIDTAILSLLKGGSSSGGVILISRGYVLAGSSNSGGTITTRDPQREILSGGSTSGGEIRVSRGYALSGLSTSGGLIDILRRYVETLSGYSNSGGRVDTGRVYIVSGTSNSGGTIDYAHLIQTVLAWLGCYVLNLDTKRTYQFSNHEFRGIGRFNDKLIGINSAGAWDLETAATHDGATDIEAYFELGSLDFGTPEIKGIRRAYIEGTGGTVVTVTFTKSDNTTLVVSMTLNQFRSLPKTLVDKYISIKVANSGGEQVTITRIEGNLNMIQRKEG